MSKIPWKRPRRVHFKGAVFRVQAVGIIGRVLFRDAWDYVAFENLIDDVKRTRPFKLHGYVCTPYGVDMVVEVGEHRLSDIMHRLLLRYAKYYNKKYGLKGHVFMKRHEQLLLDPSCDLVGTIKEIHEVPVAYGVVREVRHWPWSGLQELLGLRKRWLIDEGLPDGVCKPPGYEASRKAAWAFLGGRYRFYRPFK